MATNLHQFLVEHALFPFPPPDLGQHASTTDISEMEVAQLEEDWKAMYALPDISDFTEIL